MKVKRFVLHLYCSEIIGYVPNLGQISDGLFQSCVVAQIWFQMTVEKGKSTLECVRKQKNKQKPIKTSWWKSENDKWVQICKNKKNYFFFLHWGLLQLISRVHPLFSPPNYEIKLSYMLITHLFHLKETLIYQSALPICYTNVCTIIYSYNLSF